MGKTPWTTFWLQFSTPRARTRVKTPLRSQATAAKFQSCGRSPSYSQTAREWPIAGEFTLRAYLNGKMDLAQAEAVCDTINARTTEAYELARAQQTGRLSAEVNSIRDKILGIVARIEATIDFPEDVGEFDRDECEAQLADLLNAIEVLCASASRGILYRDGISVVIAGPPNAGKSSLLNALLRADRAIVTPIPGTTRDVIEESIDIQGIPVRLSDTAGLRETDDAVERIGVERTWATLLNADIAVIVHDALSEECDSVPFNGPQISVWNKIDLLSDRRAVPPNVTGVSALTGEGIDLLEAKIAEIALAGVGQIDKESVTVTHARHLSALVEAAESLRRAQQTLAEDLPLDFLSIDAQSALSAIGQITGETAPQEIINEIFHRFCIGK